MRWATLYKGPFRHIDMDWLSELPEELRALVKAYRMLLRPRKRIGYMRKVRVIGRVVMVEQHGVQGKGEAKEGG